MSHNLSQPDEVDMILKEMEELDMEADMPVREKNNSNSTPKEAWHAGYVPPYRAAYLRGENQ